MSLELYRGSSLLFVGPSLFTAARISDLFDVTKTIPMATSSTAYAWKRVGFLDGVEITSKRKVDKLKAAQFGVQKIVAGEDEGLEIAFDLADMTLYNLEHIVQLNPNEHAGTWFTRIKSIEGADLTLLGFPYLLYHAEYDPTNKSDVPKIGTGADPTALLIFNCAIQSDVKIPFKGPQQSVPITLASVTVDGAIDDDKGLYGCRIDLTALTAEA